MYVTLSEKDKMELLGKNYSTPYTYEGHSYKPLKGVGKNMCKNCGLVILNNDITRWCVDKGCNYSDHSSYKSVLSKLTKMPS